jgi:hypothetical protein
VSNFAFLKTQWPDLHEVVSKANSLPELDALFATLQHRAFHAES